MKIDPDKYGNFHKTMREAGPYMGLGLQLAATMIIMILIGDWLDDKYEQNYIFTLIFAFLGISIGLYNLIKTVTTIEKKKKIDEK